MAIKQQIDEDIKKAMLAGDKVLATTLRGLKSAILYAEVEKGVKDTGLGEEDTIKVLAKEAKKRQESADLYEKGGDEVRHSAELLEKQATEKYLPQQMSEAEIVAVIDGMEAKLGEITKQNMGQIIGAAKQQAGPSADGALIARLVKERLGARRPE